MAGFDAAEQELDAAFGRFEALIARLQGWRQAEAEAERRSDAAEAEALRLVEETEASAEQARAEAAQAQAERARAETARERLAACPRERPERWRQAEFAELFFSELPEADGIVGEMELKLRHMARRKHARVFEDESGDVGDQAGCAICLFVASLSTLT